MAKKRKVIITCAVTGSIHTPSMSPYLPVTADEIADAAIAASNEGAAIIHLHARNEADGRPDQTAQAFSKFLPKIHKECPAILNLTTGGSPYMSLEQRLEPAVAFEPEVASMNMGTMNFGLFPMLNRFKEFKYDWEYDYLKNSDELIFKNTYRDMAYVLEKLGSLGTRFEFECYDTAHLYNLAHFVERGLVKPPFFIQTVFGILGGIGNHPEDVMHMKRTADRLFGADYQWSVLGAGNKQMSVAAMSAAHGANLRVGLEDNLWIGPGELAESNAQQVRKARQMVEALGLEVATPDEARVMLQLKGADKVKL